MLSKVLALRNAQQQHFTIKNYVYTYMCCVEMHGNV